MYATSCNEDPPATTPIVTWRSIYLPSADGAIKNR